MKRVVRLFAIGFLGLSLILAGCGAKTTQDTGGGTDAAGTPAQTPDTKATTPGTNTTTPAASNKAPVTIGVVTSLTGGQAASGREIEVGVRAAVQDWQAKTGQQVNVVVEDDASTADNVKGAVAKLTQQKPNAIVAPLTVLTDSLDAFQAAHIPTVFCWGKRPDASASDNWLFRVCTDNQWESIAIDAVYAKELGFKHPALLYPTDLAYWPPVYKQQGLPLVNDKTYTYKSDAELTDVLKQIQADGADMIMAPGLPVDVAKIVLAAKQLGINIQIMGATATSTDGFAKAAGAAKNGVVVVANSFIGQDEESRPFVDSVKKNFNGLVATSTVGAYYDGTMMLLQAIDKAGSTDPAKVRTALQATNEFKGVAGTYTFDKAGDGKRAMIVGKWDADKLQKIKTVTAPPR